MLISLTKQDDKETLQYILDALEIESRLYKKTGSNELLVHMNELTEWYDRLKLKIETHDYTSEDKVRNRVDKIIHDKHSNRGLC